MTAAFHTLHSRWHDLTAREARFLASLVQIVLESDGKAGLLPSQWVTLIGILGTVSEPDD